MKKKLKILINKITVKLFGKNIYPPDRPSIKPNTRVTTTYPEGWHLPFDQISKNIYNELTKKL